MQHKTLIFFLAAAIVAAALACKLTGSKPSNVIQAADTPAANLGATEEALGTAVAAQATAAAEQAAAAAAQATSLAQGMANVTATAGALMAQLTSAAPIEQPTQAPAVAANPTPAVQPSATQQAPANTDLLEQLYKEGVIASKEADYHRLDDFDQSYAQIDYFQWWDIDYEAENFVLAADVAWESASDTANWFHTGCGIVFSENDESHLNLAYMSLDGYGSLVRVTPTNTWDEFAAKFDKNFPTPDGNAEMILVVYDKKLTLFIDGKQVVNGYDASLNPGALGLAVLSGTNKGFGTRCKMTNMDLFIFK